MVDPTFDNEAHASDAGSFARQPMPCAACLRTLEPDDLFCSYCGFPAPGTIDLVEAGEPDDPDRVIKCIACGSAFETLGRGSSLHCPQCGSSFVVRRCPGCKRAVET